jgi:hypothetical protein
VLEAAEGAPEVDPVEAPDEAPDVAPDAPDEAAELVRRVANAEVDAALLGIVT